MNRIAVIVIGSNSIRSLICDENPALSNPFRGRVETRLLLHLELADQLSDSAVQLLASGVEQLYAQIRQQNATLTGLYATSAVRDTANAQMLSDVLCTLCGQPLQVLSGHDEAVYSFYGAVGHLPRAGMIDIGGGSAEIALGSGTQLAHALSLQLGASRLFKQQPINSPQDIAPALACAQQVAAALAPLSAQCQAMPFYLVGGTGTCVAQILAARRELSQAEGICISRQDIHTLLEEIAAMPPDVRASGTLFPPERADILPTGMAVLSAILQALDLQQVQVTERGNTDGLLRAFVHKKFA